MTYIASASYLIIGMALSAIYVSYLGKNNKPVTTDQAIGFVLLWPLSLLVLIIIGSILFGSRVIFPILETFKDSDS